MIITVVKYIIESVWDYMKKLKKLRQNKSRKTGNVSKTLEETCLHSYSTVESLRHFCKNAVNENVFENNFIIINRFYISIHFY